MTRETQLPFIVSSGPGPHGPVAATPAQAQVSGGSPRPSQGSGRAQSVVAASYFPPLLALNKSAPYLRRLSCPSPTAAKSGLLHMQIGSSNLLLLSFPLAATVLSAVSPSVQSSPGLQADFAAAFAAAVACQTFAPNVLLHKIISRATTSSHTKRTRSQWNQRRH